MRPQTAIIKASDLGQRVEAPAMRIAGAVIELFEFAKYGEGRICAEDPFQLVEVGDFLSAQVPAEDN
jgi:hypothetical protein